MKAIKLLFFLNLVGLTVMHGQSPITIGHLHTIKNETNKEMVVHFNTIAAPDRKETVKPKTTTRVYLGDPCVREINITSKNMQPISIAVNKDDYCANFSIAIKQDGRNIEAHVKKSKEQPMPPMTFPSTPY